MNAPARHAAGAAAALVLVLSALACRTPDPKALLEVSDVDAFWAVEPTMGGEQYIAPVVKLRIHNRSDEPQHSVQAMAVFRRKGEENLTWGSAFEQVVSRKNPLAPGQSIGVTLKSDARYHSQGPVDGMFTHARVPGRAGRDLPARRLQRLGRASGRCPSSAVSARARWPRRLPLPRRRRPCLPARPRRRPSRRRRHADVSRVGFSHVTGPAHGRDGLAPPPARHHRLRSRRRRARARHRRPPRRRVRARRDGGAPRQRVRAGHVPGRASSCRKPSCARGT